MDWTECRWDCPDGVSCVEYDHDRGLVALGLENYLVQVRELKLGRREIMLGGLSARVAALLFTSDGDLVGGSWSGYMIKWDLASGRWLWSSVLQGCVNALAEVNSSGWLVASSTGGSVFVLDIATGHNVASYRGRHNVLFAFTPLQHSGSFYSSSHTCIIRMWAGDGSPMETVKLTGSPVSLSGISPCGELAVAGCLDGSLRLYRVPQWEQRWFAKTHADLVESVCFSPDGRMIASASFDHTVKLTSTRTGFTLRVLQGHTDWVCGVRFSRDGAKVLSGSKDKTLRIWRLSFPAWRAIRSLLHSLEIDREDWETREVAFEIVRRVKRKF